MRSEMIYVELKTGYADNGPAWIGTGVFNRTGQTVYFNGQVFKRSAGTGANHFNLATGDEYWISGVKRRGENRHWAGSGKIEIDECVVDEFMVLKGLTTLPRNKYAVVKLESRLAKEVSKDLENQLRYVDFDESLRFKNTSDLTDAELNDLIDYYQNLEMTSLPKKSRKGFVDKINLLIEMRGVREGIGL